MNTDTVNRGYGKFLVDIEVGTVLRADDEVEISRRWLDSHPFVIPVGDGRRVLAGPDAELQAKTISNAGDFVTYDIAREVAGAVTLRRDRSGEPSV